MLDSKLYLIFYVNFLYYINVLTFKYANAPQFLQ